MFKVKKFSPQLLKILRNISWLTGEKVIRMGINFFVVIYVVKYLGSEDFGKLSYCISFVSLFDAIAKLGLDNIVVRNLVREEGSRDVILGTAFGLKLIGSLLAFLLIVTSISATHPTKEVWWMTIVIGLSMFFSAFDVIDYWFQSQVKSGAISFARIVQVIIISLAKLGLIIANFPLIAFVWLVLIDYATKRIFITIVYLKERLSLFSWKFSYLQGKNLLADSWSLILSSVMIAIYMKIDQVMLGNMADIQAVGNYATAVKFSEIWYFVPVAICSSVFPTIIKARARSKKEYYTKLQKLYDFMVVISVFIAVPITFLAKPIIINLLGTEYTTAATILSCHIWAGVFAFLRVARSRWLMAENLTIFNFATTSLGAVTNIILNYYLIPQYQGMGAAIATVISYGVSGYLSCFVYPPMFNTGWMLTKALLLPLRCKKYLVSLF
ncbi:MAG: flippase [Xenococcaceae cyanobacterium MO_207.B15]|nr:flippase [Xenococcaceae cyanobacterium MO_207.B15]MDJ0745911.1 flippase [Xenococcaceae cyanobacterium MO_167.B27]